MDTKIAHPEMIIPNYDISPSAHVRELSTLDKSEPPGITRHIY